MHFDDDGADGDVGNVKCRLAIDITDCFSHNHRILDAPRRTSFS